MPVAATIVSTRVESSLSLGVSVSSRVEWFPWRGSTEWGDFVQAHGQGTIYHTPAWLGALEDGFAHMQGRIVVIRDQATRRIRSGIPVVTVNSWFLGTRLISLPLAPVCRPLVAELSDVTVLLREVQRELKATGGRSVEIKLGKADTNVVPQDWTVLNNFKHHYIDLTPSWPLVQSAISKSCRRMADKARRAGTSVNRVSYENNWKIFHQLFEANRRRLGLPLVPAKFFAALGRHLGDDQVLLLLAKRAETVLGALICLKHRGQISAEFIGEAELDGTRCDGINQLLYHEAIRLACEQGCVTFSFGRTANDNIGLLEFKRRWATIEEGAPIAVYPAVHLNSHLRRISGSRLLGAFFRHSPPLLYRCASNFCYRHWG